MRRIAAALLCATAIGCGARDPPQVTEKGTFDSLVAFGEQVYRREEYDSARLMLGPVAERARAARDSTAEARARTWLGLACWRLSDYPCARAEQERALALKVALRLDRELWRSYNALGLVAWNESRLTDALARFSEATAAAQQVGDSVGLGSTAGNVGLVYTDLGDFSAARQGFARMRAIGHAAGNGRVEGNALNNLGMLDIRIGNPQSAVLGLREALRLYREIEYATGEQNALGQLGTAYAALGEPQVALGVLDSALQQARSLGLRQDEASDVEALADLHRVAGDYSRALELYGTAKALNQELGQPVELGADLRSEAEIHVRLGDLELARRSALAALTTHREAGARFEQLGDLLLLAEIADRSGQAEEAERHLSAARPIAVGLDARAARLGLALAEARIAGRGGASRRVLAVLDRAAHDLALGGYDTEWEAELLRARAEARLGLLERAAASGRRAVAAVERVRGSYGSRILRTTYGADRAEAYAELVGVLQRLGRVDEAFAVSDAARGRALLERQASDHAPDALRERAALLGEIGGLITPIDSIERDARGNANASQRATIMALSRRLEDARSRYEMALARRMEGVPIALLGGGEARASDVKSVLGADEALLEFLVTTDRVVGFVLTRDGVTAFARPIAEQNLAGRVRLARAALARPGGVRSNAPVLEVLYDLLIAPARLSPAVRRLVIVPHGVLTYLPFAALRDSRKGRYLIESLSILYAPSAAALPELRRRPHERGAGEPRATVYAPFPDRLPATVAEADALRRVLGADVQLGSRATEARVRGALFDGVIVHAATHGALDRHNPLFSRIDLAGEGVDPANDGRLEVHEILDLSVKSPLVFLSGCETGLGVSGSTAFASGEDFATLGQAFLYAGAQNVVATLWRVEDQGAAAFAERFYRRAATLGAPEALAQAQRDLLQGGRYRAPFYWAAYTLSGAGTVTQDSARVSVRH